MKKLFISADIEGTCGITSWDETLKGRPEYAAFAAQMSREVAAACEGALEAGMEFILVRDAHDSGLNIDWSLLPLQVQMIRGWGSDPLSMMMGLDDSFHAAVFTGYHDAAGTGENPLSHTMSTGLIWLTLNSEPVSEGMINAFTAAAFKVPVIAVSGDAGICVRMKNLIPNCHVVPVNQGMGNAVKSIHPGLALNSIREAVRQACAQPREDCELALPSHFRLDVRYREHHHAFKSGFYPGVQKLDSHTLRFEADEWSEVLRMMLFCL
jgi:D-amino peptidase